MNRQYQSARMAREMSQGTVRKALELLFTDVAREIGLDKNFRGVDVYERAGLGNYNKALYVITSSKEWPWTFEQPVAFDCIIKSDGIQIQKSHSYFRRAVLEDAAIKVLRTYDDSEENQECFLDINLKL